MTGGTAGETPAVRVQLITAAGASFKLDGGRLVPSSPESKWPEAGEIVQIKTIVTHPQEPGTRRLANGTTPPRDIVQSFRASFRGADVFAAHLGPGVTANPYVAFHMRLTGSGDLRLSWAGDNGFTMDVNVPITVA